MEVTVEGSTPLNPVNAMLSFIYAMLSNDVASSLESVGLDAYAGFMHTDRPGRISLALPQRAEPYSIPFLYFLAFLPLI